MCLSIACDHPLNVTQLITRDSSTCNVACPSPGQPYYLSHGYSRHGTSAMGLPEVCNAANLLLLPSYATYSVCDQDRPTNYPTGNPGMVYLP